MAKNRKIKNATQNTLNNIEFKSRLEAVIYKSLKESGFEPQYESTKYIIWEGFYPTIPFYNKDSKTGLLKLDNKKLINITYTPDFSFTYNDNITDGDWYDVDDLERLADLLTDYERDLQEFIEYNITKPLEVIEYINDFKANQELIYNEYAECNE